MYTLRNKNVLLLIQSIFFLCQIAGTAITFQTISYNSSYTNITALEEFHTFLREKYDLIFGGRLSFVNVEEVNTHSLLIRVEGQRPTKNPFLLCGHMDVVPIASGQWARHPFSGDIYRYLMPGSFHLSSFAFRQFCRRSYQNQLSFSGKDSTADFFVFRQDDKKRKMNEPGIKA